MSEPGQYNIPDEKRADSSPEIPNLIQLVEIERKNSRFIATAYRVTADSQVKPIIESLKAFHPKANHHCWAAVYGSPEDSMQYAFSDDGEPSGTAGKPMLNVIKGWPIGQCLVVVTRLFGGVKLGTGGLVRAYGDATKAVLEQLPITTVVPSINITFITTYDEQNAIQQLLHRYEVPETDITADYGAEITWSLSVPASEQTAFVKALSEATSGRLTEERITIA